MLESQSDEVSTGAEVEEAQSVVLVTVSVTQLVTVPLAVTSVGAL